MQGRDVKKVSNGLQMQWVQGPWGRAHLAWSASRARVPWGLLSATPLACSGPDPAGLWLGSVPLSAWFLRTG